jgi:hypothetical protein
MRKPIVWRAVAGLAPVALVVFGTVRLTTLDSPLPPGVVEDERSLPSDRALIELHARRARDFDKLVAMATVDRQLVRVAPDFVWTTKSVAWPRPESELGISRARWDQYRRLFLALELPAGFIQPDDRPQVIYVISGATGLAVGGVTKGFAWSEASMEPRCESLDWTDGPKQDGVCFRPIARGWYLFLERD